MVDISASTVARWLAADAIKPWQYQSWIAPRAPDFASKAAVVLDLYARVFDGTPLGPGDYVLCSDEKTSVQARCHCHPTLPPGKSQVDARGTRIRPGWRAGLPGRLGRPPGARFSAAASPPPASPRFAGWWSRS